MFARECRWSLALLIFAAAAAYSSAAMAQDDSFTPEKQLSESKLLKKLTGTDKSRIEAFTDLQSRGDDKLTAKLLIKVKESSWAIEAYYLRGRENFKAGSIDASLADFDKYVKLRPDLESRQWERGISDYYAGKFKKGAKQFELYQTFHDNDVENSTWRCLCDARLAGR